MKIIDGTDLIAGRLATKVARMALEGETIRVVNAEKVVISGRPRSIINQWTERIHKGNALTGPYYPKRPDKILKRIIRGMLSYKKERGSKAFKRIKTYIGVPPEFEGKTSTIPEVNMMNKHIIKHISIGELSKRLGGPQ